MVIISFGLPLTYAYATLRQSVAGNSTFRGIVYCNLGTPKTVISNFVTTRQIKTPYSSQDVRRIERQFVSFFAMMSTRSKWTEGMSGVMRLSKAIISLEGKVAGKVTSSSPPRKPARRGSIQSLLDKGVDPGPVCLLLDVLAAPPRFGY